MDEVLRSNGVMSVEIAAGDFGQWTRDGASRVFTLDPFKGSR
jgi:hypothetical protein